MDDDELINNALSSLFVFGAIFFIGSIGIYTLHHVYVVPEPGQQQYLENEVLQEIRTRPDCTVKDLATIAEEIDVNMWTTRYIVQQLINDDLLGVDRETGDIVQTPCFKTIEH